MQLDASHTNNFCESQLLTVLDVARLLAVTDRQVRNLRATNKIPPCLKFGGSVRRRRSDIAAWVAAGCPPQVSHQ